MFNTANLSLPNPEDLRALQLDTEAMRAAVKLRATVAQQISRMKLESLLVIATQQFPEESPHMAVLKLHAEIDHTLRDLAQFGEDLDSIEKAEKERLAPVMSGAVRRLFDSVRELEGVDRGLKFIHADVDARRNKLLAAGVMPHEADRLIADGQEDREARRTELNEQRQSLLAEQEALNSFIRTGNERHLPEGFRVVEVLRTTFQDVVQPPR